MCWGEAGVHAQDAVNPTELTCELTELTEPRSHWPGEASRRELTPNLDLGVGISQMRKREKSL